MKVLITGGNGFIGRNLKEQLERKHDVFAPASKELDLLDKDETERYLNKHHFDLILHAATWNATRNSQKDLSKVLENNLLMFFNLVKFKKDFGRLINFGSGAEYDRVNWMPKMREDYFDQHVPKEGYGLSKYKISKSIEDMDNAVNLRLFAVFGKYEDWEIRFVSNACCKAVYDLPITIKQNVVFDYMHIDDLVKIIEWFMNNKPRFKQYNVCTGTTYDLKTIAKKVIAASGKKLRILVKKEGLGREYSGDNSRLMSELGDFKFALIDEKIKELYSWYLSRKSSIDRNKLLVDK